MVLVKLFRNSDQETFVQVTAVSLKSLKENAEKNLNFKIKKFLNKQDNCEMHDEDLFIEELELASKKNEKLEIITVESSSENDSSSELSSQKSKQKKMKSKEKLNAKKTSKEKDETKKLSSSKKSSSSSESESSSETSSSTDDDSDGHKKKSSKKSHKSSPEDEKNKKSDSKSSENLDMSDNDIKNLLKLKKLLFNRQKTDTTASVLAASVSNTNSSTISRTNSIASMIRVTKDETTSNKSTTTAARTTERKSRRTLYEESLKKELDCEKEKKLKKQNERKEGIENLKEDLTNVKKQTNVRKKTNLRKMEEKELKEKVAWAKLRHQINKLFEELKEDEKDDLCFMLDCKGSMASYIKAFFPSIGKNFLELNIT